jgi:archaetidylinositol phosphate synthase
VLNPLVLPLVRLLRHVHPNHVTIFGFFLVFPAAALFWKSDPATEADNYYLLVAAALVILHGLLDLVDGAIARAYHKTSRLGDFLDHVADRLADTILLAALAFSPWCDVRVGLWAIAATLLTSYLGTQAQALGAGRMYSGFLARADRLVLLMGVPIVDHILVQRDVTFQFLGQHSALGLVLLYIAVGGGITTIERFIRIRRFLAKNPTP